MGQFKDIGQRGIPAVGEEVRVQQVQVNKSGPSDVICKPTIRVKTGELCDKQDNGEHRDGEPEQQRKFQDPVELEVGVKTKDENDQPECNQSTAEEKQRHVFHDLESDSRPLQPDASSIPVKNVKGRCLKFQASWYSKYPWLHFSITLQRILCFFCSRASVPQDSHPEPAFVTKGFRNWKKALEKFAEHDASCFHRRAVKHGQASTPVSALLIKRNNEQQSLARRMLLMIMTSLRFLARQGLAMRGHEDKNGNFEQLLLRRVIPKNLPGG
jgi:hypothetical protein